MFYTSTALFGQVDEATYLLTVSCGAWHENSVRCVGEGPYLENPTEEFHSKSSTANLSARESRLGDGGENTFVPFRTYASCFANSCMSLFHSVRTMIVARNNDMSKHGHGPDHETHSTVHLPARPRLVSEPSHVPGALPSSVSNTLLPRAATTATSASSYAVRRPMTRPPTMPGESSMDGSDSDDTSTTSSTSRQRRRRANLRRFWEQKATTTIATPAQVQQAVAIKLGSIFYCHHQNVDGEDDEQSLSSLSGYDTDYSRSGERVECDDGVFDANAATTVEPVRCATGQETTC